MNADSYSFVSEEQRPVYILHDAILSGDLATFILALEAHSVAVNVIHPDSLLTALHLAISLEDDLDYKLTVIRELLNLGADRSIPDPFGYDALTRARELGELEVYDDMLPDGYELEVNIEEIGDEEEEGEQQQEEAEWTYSDQE